jgi:predicted RNase H-like HicB family nuclease
MKLKAIVHKAEEGGFWAEIPAIPGCVTQGDTLGELIKNIHEAAEACLSVDVKDYKIQKDDQLMEIIV